jgi:hypothetical protein
MNYTMKHLLYYLVFSANCAAMIVWPLVNTAELFFGLAWCVLYLVGLILYP